MTLFTVDGDGTPLGIAAAPTQEAAIDLVRILCRAHERELANGIASFSTAFKLTARLSTTSEEEVFQRSSVSGGVRLAGILITEPEPQPQRWQTPRSN
jgi:hypothetical protein